MYYVIYFFIMRSTPSDIMIPYKYVEQSFAVVIIFMQIKQYDDSNDIQIMVIIYIILSRLVDNIVFINNT